MIRATPSLIAISSTRAVEAQVGPVAVVDEAVGRDVERATGTSGERGRAGEAGGFEGTPQGGGKGGVGAVGGDFVPIRLVGCLTQEDRLNCRYR